MSDGGKTASHWQKIHYLKYRQKDNLAIWKLPLKVEHLWKQVKNNEPSASLAGGQQLHSRSFWTLGATDRPAGSVNARLVWMERRWDFFLMGLMLAFKLEEVLIVIENLSHLKIWQILLKMVTKTNYPGWKDGLIQGTDGIWTHELLFTGQAL